MEKKAFILSVAALLAIGCAPADVAGSYSVATTNGANTCSIDGWEAGATGTNIPVVITQNGDVVQVAVEGLLRTWLDIAVGGHLFNGTVGGSHIQADLVGSTSYRQGGCTYTFTLELDADLNGDFLQGEVVYRPVTNGHADCGVLDTCSNVQSFNGTRPPSE